jgi:serine protease
MKSSIFVKTLAVACAVGTLFSSAGASADTAPYSWGLDRIDSISKDGSFTPNTAGGAGVRVYVMDTGVQGTNPGFDGRVLAGWDTFTNKPAGNVDCSGHGTHVAGVIGSSTWGVARRVTIVPVKVADCSGSAPYANLVAGATWILNNNPRGVPAVVNISVTGAKYAVYDAVLDKLVQAGVTVITSAGNNNTDACQTSPSDDANVISVSSINMNDYRTNGSNTGECVDMYAPGGLIPSENSKNPLMPLTLIGTSMAAPFVSGAAALYLSIRPTAKPAQILADLKANALKGAVVDAKSINGNYLLNTSFLGSMTR